MDVEVESLVIQRPNHGVVLARVGGDSLQTNRANGRNLARPGLCGLNRDEEKYTEI